MKRLAKIRKCKETLGNKQSINRPNYLGIITGPSRCNSTNEKNVREGDREREPKKRNYRKMITVRLGIAVTIIICYSSTTATSEVCRVKASFIRRKHVLKRFKFAECTGTVSEGLQRCAAC